MKDNTNKLSSYGGGKNKNVDNMQKLNHAEKTCISFVMLCCCTCKRPKMLSETLKSVNSLIIPDDIKVEMLVVDNDKDASAKTAVEEARKDLKMPVHYFVEENRGIAYARNRVLEEAIKLGADHIFFFDDDEVLTQNCLNTHIKLYNENPDTYISSGPTINKFMGDFPKYITKHIVFKQKYTKKTGCKKEDCACGNVFFPLSIAKDYNLRFSTEYVFMGGEDGDFFYRASNLGFNIIWNREAVIEEMITEERANIPYILKKCYYNGYAGTMQRIKRLNNNFGKYIYLLRQIPVLLFYVIFIIPSLLFGLSVFYNVLGILYRTKGKIDACIKNSPINFYNNIYGR